MKAFLEKINNEWLDDFVYISQYPLKELGYEIVAFDDLYNPLENNSIDRESDICIGSVQATNKFFELCGITPPKYLGYPEQLRKYLGREMTKLKFSELNNNYPYFIKPADDIKLFTGGVISNDRHLEYLKIWDSVKDDTLIFKSDIINFISEYRAFISFGKIYGLKHYNGDHSKFIDYSILENMVSDFKDCPSAFTLDIGLTDDGRTLLVEVNDMWAIGSYGMDGKDYSLLCARRMKEILK